MPIAGARARSLTRHSRQEYPGRAYCRILEPALAYVGQLWGEQLVSLAQGFVGAKIAEDVLVRCLPAGGASSPVSPKGMVVIGNIEDDFHSLGGEW